MKYLLIIGVIIVVYVIIRVKMKDRF